MDIYIGFYRLIWLLGKFTYWVSLNFARCSYRVLWNILFLVSNGPARFFSPLFLHFYVLHETEMACEHKENAAGEKSK